MENQFDGCGVSLIQTYGGVRREKKFESGKQLANWVWKYSPKIFTELKQSEQRD